MSIARRKLKDFLRLNATNGAYKDTNEVAKVIAFEMVLKDLVIVIEKGEPVFIPKSELK